MARRLWLSSSLACSWTLPAGLFADDRVEMPLVRDSLERVHAPVFEGQAGPSHEVLHGARDQNLTWPREGGHPSADVYSDATDVVAGELDLARMHPRPDLQAERQHGLGDGLRAPDGPSRPVEGGEEPIAGGVDLPPSEPFDQGTNSLVMGIEQFSPAAIPQRGRLLRRANDVSEQNGRKHPVEFWSRADAGEKLLDLVDQGVRIAHEWSVVRARQLDIFRAGDL